MYSEKQYNGKQNDFKVLEQETQRV